MTVAVLNDVHGNLPALEAVLAELDRDPVDTILCGGDVVWGPYPSACLELLRARGALFLSGNTERLVLGASDERHAWALERLSEEQRVFVAGWPGTVALDVEGLGRVLFCHGTPRSDEEILTAGTPEDVLAEALAGVDADVVVGGHTHHQFDRRAGRTRFVNAGSVGLPYEGVAGAFWTRLGPGVDPRRTEYDLAAAVERLREAGLPGLDELLEASLLEPLPREAAVAEFEAMAGRGP